jgi:hypothetical protein
VESHLSKGAKGGAPGAVLVSPLLTNVTVARDVRHPPIGWDGFKGS